MSGACHFRLLEDEDAAAARREVVAWEKMGPPVKKAAAFSCWKGWVSGDDWQRSATTITGFLPRDIWPIESACLRLSALGSHLVLVLSRDCMICV